MASIFKRTKKRSEPYTIQYVDHLGKRRTRKGFTDKGLTEELAAKLESEARLRTSGMIDAVQDRLAEQLALPIEIHLTSFEESLSDNTSKHVKLTMTRIKRIVEGCEFKTLRDIEGERIVSYLRKLRTENNIGHRTYNHYLQAFDSFCYWCVLSKRLLTNPIIGVERLNAAVDVRQKRRALNSSEVASLIKSARESKVIIRNYSGEQRARLYLMSYLTGLRRKELASLTPQSFNLSSVPPTITIEAGNSKHRKKDTIPIHPDLQIVLPEWLRVLKSGEFLFPDLANKETGYMVKKDLVSTGIPYETSQGVIDFHAAGRHTYITELLRNGTSIVEAKELARHADINMTMKYTHIGIEDQARALSNLPSAKTETESIEPTDLSDEKALQMRCNFCSAEGHSVSQGGNQNICQESDNPCNDKGYDTDRLPVSPIVKLAGAGLEPARGLPLTGF